MKLSARNQFNGIVTAVEEGAVNGIVTLEFAGQNIKGTISMAAIRELGLCAGVPATAVIKATDVMIGLGALEISARNQLEGVITDIDLGAVNAVVRMNIAGDNTLSATISISAVKELGLKTGMTATGVIKATSVMFMTD